ncbi:DUF1273 domain-containing protein [Pisciglobus halotolerans]|uniref:UPF0398 protein SAMN04489868_10598 n=1 Tax=Pisciglobus halotolerans TaxID=745365 RepID=A0A1I3BCD5_9LACT|nr:DUF1273 domain-containing protein [Pisciglobus halotolerans]SFH59967.1 Uncharacterized SPBc2 prophage-derived protein YoqJ [Pisciglobus halotolerans]
MTNLYISGYRSFELGIFQKNDPKIAVIKNAIKRELISLIEEGVEWIITSGQLGVEQWAAEVVEEIRLDYPEIQQALILPFEGFGSNWNEQNQLSLQETKLLMDFIESTSHQAYVDPSQLKNHQQFILHHTDAALLVYDPEHKGKTAFLYEAIKSYQEQEDYECRLIDFDQLNTFEG